MRKQWGLVAVLGVCLLGILGVGAQQYNQAHLMMRGGTWAYETVGASASAQALGTTGGVGDVLRRLVVTVTTAATGTVSLTDGVLSIQPVTAANTPIGVYIVDFEAVSVSGAWQVTTGAGATVHAIGRFTN